MRELLHRQNAKNPLFSTKRDHGTMHRYYSLHRSSSQKSRPSSVPSVEDEKEDKGLQRYLLMGYNI